MSNSKIHAGDDSTDSKHQLGDSRSLPTNEFLFSLIESSIDAIMAADMKGNILIFNKGAEKLLGYKADDVIGKINVVNFYPEGVAQDIMQKLRDGRYGGRGKLLPMRITGLTKSGERLPISISASIMYQDGREVATMGIFYDLREILKAKEDLSQSEDRFRSLFDLVQQGVFFSSREGKFLDGNRAIIDLLGYDDKEEFLAMDLAKDLYIDPSHRASFQEMIERDGSVKDYPMQFKKKNGEAIDVLLTAHLEKDRSDKVLGYQGLVFDITERTKLEQQLFQSEKLAAMGRLTAQVAHELNNPIYGIMNCLDLLKSEIPKDNKKRRFMDMAYSEAVRMSELLKKMINFFRPDDDVKSNVDLNQLIEDVVLFVGKQLHEFQVKVVMELEVDLPQVYSSGNQMKQVLLNMIMNARNAMANGGTLTISSHNLQDKVALQIADTGRGILPENIDRIFDAFFTTKGDVKGVGLGLSVCFGIIHDHGGKIDVESEPGKGTTFTVTLPIQG